MTLEKRQAKLRRFLAELKKHCEWSAGEPLPLHYKFTEDSNESVLAEDWTGWPVAEPTLIWGGAKKHHWFATSLPMPEAPDDAELVLRIRAENVVLMGRTQGQGLVWLNGEILQGVDGYHPEIVLEKCIPAGDMATLHINHYTGDSRQLCGYQLERLWRDKKAQQLYYDLNVPFEVSLRLADNDLRKHRILDLIDEALHFLDFRDQSRFSASLPAALETAARIYQLTDTQDKPTASCVGHTHIDVAWLWPVSQTREKMMRSMATALKLLDENPDFVFMYNQCVLLDYLEQDAPELFARIKKHAANGRFEIEGAMWLEPDVNIISGESMVRQLQRGKRYHMEKFGVEPKILWLPDTFGYSAAMPQIMRKAGVEFLVTSKLSWNDTNRMPNDTFFWHGIDGTEVKTYLITTQKDDAPTIRTNYGPDLNVSFVQGAWNRYEPKRLNDNILIPFGHGDGGGGVTQEMIEVAQRMERGIPGSPKIRFEGIVPFLARLGAKMDATPQKFAKWVGELYLEYHRGTLTSLGKNKRSNRLAEALLKDLEFVIAQLAIAKEGVDLHGNALNEFWRITLLNQFHDILPGTSIAEVYRDSDRDYERLFAAIDELMSRVLAGAVTTPMALVNASSINRDGELASFGQLPDEAAATIDVDGTALPLQTIHRADGTCEKATRLPAVPATRVIAVAPSTNPVDLSHLDPELAVDERRLENRYLRIEFDESGEIVSFFDKEKQREVLRQGGKANRLVAFEDKPLFWDAWDIDWYFDEKSWPVDPATQIDIVERGPHRAALRIERRYNASTIVQIISLGCSDQLVEFDTHVDWKESQTLLKAGFELDILTTDVKSEIQFGHVTRPTHENTSWDQARFEASMHKWVALTESGYGAAVLNDCKYGYDARNGDLRITLIKSGIYPFETADQEEHRFRYALTIAHGEAALTTIARRAECFSHPLKAIAVAPGTSQGSDARSAIKIDAPNVALHAFKASDCGQKILVRLVEESNQRVAANIHFGFPVDRIERVDLMDRPLENMPTAADGSLPLTFTPFEIVSLAVTIRREN